MTDLMNELMNDEAVYRTAPATPGLLIKSLDQSSNDIYYFLYFLNIESFVKSF